MKRVRYLNSGFDAIDTQILRALTNNARIAMKDLARQIGLSAPSTKERVRRLEEIGLIQAYTTRVSPVALGLPLGVIIRVRPMPGELSRVANLLAAKQEVVQCDRVTGDDCFVAKAFVASVEDLEKLIDDLLPYATTNTSVIQSTPVEARMPARRQRDE